MMICLVLLLLIGQTQCIPVPFITNVSLVAIDPINTTTIVNKTCQQCVCDNQKINAVAVNCFPFNRTCQYFFSFPHSYRMPPTTQSRLYFPQRTFPPASQCCTSKWTGLLIDDNDYLVTIQDLETILSRFHLVNLSFVDQTIFPGSFFMTVAYFSQAYYIGRDDFTILVVSSDTLAVLNTITSSNIQGPRDIVFLRNSQLLVLASADNDQLLFFNRSTSGSTNYQYAYACPTSYQWPHGLVYVNDSFFYATSWYTDTIESYTVNGNRTCTENLYINATFITGSSGGGSGSHVTMDDCGRSWFSTYNLGLFIFDNGGSYLGNFSRIGHGLFDMLLIDNYVMYLSDNVGGRIVRLDPRLTCWITVGTLVHFHRFYCTLCIPRPFQKTNSLIEFPDLDYSSVNSFTIARI